MLLDGELIPLYHFWPVRRSRNKWDNDWELYKDGGEDKKNKFRLPYSIGQKYTFGTKFTSREEQGELIFLSRRHLKDPDDPFVCQIVCEDDKYWVSSSGKNKIFINEVEMGATTKTKLAFGDVLSFVERDKDSGKYYCEQQRFLFQERQLTPDKDFDTEEDDDDPWTVGFGNKLVLQEIADGSNSNPLVGQNELIVSKILSYLPLNDVKKARLVSKTWNSEAISFIKKGAWAQLKINAYDKVQTTIKLFLFCNDFKDNPGLVQKLELILPRFPSTHIGWRYPPTLSSWDGAEGTKFTSDIHWFLGQVQNVTQLNLYGTIVNSQEDFDIQIAILEKLAGTLKKLELSGTWMKYRTTEESDYGSYTFPTTLNFPRLRSFTWSISFFTVDWDFAMLDRDYSDWYYDRDQAVNYNSSNFDWIGDLIQAVSHVKELRIRAAPELGNFLARKLDSFRNLEQLSLCHIISAELKEKLLELKNPLKSLTWDYLTQEDTPFFEEFLQKHGNSLETLKFGLPFEGEVQRSESTIVIPALPRLKELSVEYYQYSFYSNLKFGEPPGIIDYAEHFPCLHSLTLKGNNAKEFLGYFFPFYNRGKEDFGNEQVCRTLQYLDFHHWHDDKELGIRKVDEIAKMFPNVRNNWIKRMDEWDEDDWY